MLRPILLGSAIVLTLSGCARIADSRLNPVNWFGNSRAEAVTAPADLRPLVPAGARVVVADARERVTQVTALTIDRAASGAVVRATGLAPTQGYFNAELVNAGVENGVLTLDFRAQAPAGFQALGTPRSRQITAAYVISAADLAGIRRVRVQAAENARTSSR